MANSTLQERMDAKGRLLEQVGIMSIRIVNTVAVIQQSCVNEPSFSFFQPTEINLNTSFPPNMKIFCIPTFPLCLVLVCLLLSIHTSPVRTTHTTEIFKTSLSGLCPGSWVWGETQEAFLQCFLWVWQEEDRPRCG